MGEVWDFLREPWTFEFMLRGLLAALVISVVAGVVGSFVVLRGMAFIGDALPHASFGGVAIAFAIGANLQLGGAIAVVLSALLIGFLGSRRLVRYDTAIGLTFAGAFALGILIVSRQEGYVVDLFGFVFGNVLGVTWTDVWITAAVGFLVVATVLLFYKELLFTAYDPTMAAASGVPVPMMEYGLLILIGLAVVIALKVMGIVLVLAMLVAPAASAQLLTRRLSMMMLVASVLGVASSVIGLYVAWYLDASASASIVLTAVSAFILIALLAPGKGLLSQWRAGSGLTAPGD
jgi:ABC-type Mn2+/Zn2+ transport system permease subunit